MSFVETYRATREINSDVEAILEAFDTGWQGRAASQKLEEKRVSLMLPLLSSVIDSWVDCVAEERQYHRHSFRENLGSICIWLFIAGVALAPISAFILYLVYTFPIARTSVFLLGAGIVSVAWLLAPRIPPWNVRDRRARSAALAAEYLLERVNDSDASVMNERHHSVLLEILQGSSNPRSVRYNLTLSLSVLKALEHVGDGRYLRTVERIAQKEHGLLRDSACSCLPFLRERDEKDATSRALLRPSGPLYSANEALLRSVRAHDVDLPYLLRQYDAESENSTPGSECSESFAA